jgi:rRNA-processing protein FCF1
MKRILVDTSSIVFSFQNKKDIFIDIEERLEAKVVISLGIRRELQRLSARRNNEGRAAKLAIQVMRLHEVEVLQNAQPVDDFLVAAGADGKIEVCTNDIELKRRLLGIGLKPYSVSRKGILR